MRSIPFFMFLTHSTSHCARATDLWREPASPQCSQCGRSLARTLVPSSQGTCLQAAALVSGGGAFALCNVDSSEAQHRRCSHEAPFPVREAPMTDCLAACLLDLSGVWRQETAESLFYHSLSMCYFAQNPQLLYRALLTSFYNR